MIECGTQRLFNRNEDSLISYPSYLKPYLPHGNLSFFDIFLSSMSGKDPAWRQNKIFELSAHLAVVVAAEDIVILLN